MSHNKYIFVFLIILVIFDLVKFDFYSSVYTNNFHLSFRLIVFFLNMVASFRPLHYGLLTCCAAMHRSDLRVREHTTLTFTNKIPPRSRQNHTAPLCAPLSLHTASQEGLILLDLYFARGSTSRRAPLCLSLSLFIFLSLSLSSSVVRYLTWWYASVVQNTPVERFLCSIHLPFRHTHWHYTTSTHTLLSDQCLNSQSIRPLPAVPTSLYLPHTATSPGERPPRSNQLPPLRLNKWPNVEKQTHPKWTVSLCMHECTGRRERANTIKSLSCG